MATFTTDADGAQEFVTFLLPRAEARVREVPALCGRAFELRDGGRRDLFVTGAGVVEAASAAVPVPAATGFALARDVGGRWVVETLGLPCAE